MRKHVILSAGGTGGHLFPAQALAKKLQPYAEVIFVAGGLSSNAFFDREAHTYQDISTATFSFSRPWQVVSGALSICQGTYSALRIMKKFKPDLVVGFGSFHTVPVLTASLMQRLPFILHEQNLIPGRVNRFFSSKAKMTALTFSQTSEYVKGPSQLVSMPKHEYESENPWLYYGWEPGPLTLLVYGGSQGAQALNDVMIKLCHRLQSYRILHFVGARCDAQKIHQIYTEYGVVACVKNFEPRMDLALHVADLAICRAGASTICELMATHTPAILIPYPYANSHQLNNAQYFVNQAGGGKIILQQDLDDKSLFLALSEFDLKTCCKNLKNYTQNQQMENFENLILRNL